MFKDDLTDEVTRVNYISVMADGATDARGLENETVYARLIRDGRPVNRLVGHKAVEHATVEGNNKKTSLLLTRSAHIAILRSHT